MKKLFLSFVIFLSAVFFVIPMSAEASGETAISTVVPSKYTITIKIEGGGSIEYENATYKTGDTIQVTEGCDVIFYLKPDSQYRLKSVVYNGSDITQQVTDGKITVSNIKQDADISITYAKLGSGIAPITGYSISYLLFAIPTLGGIGILIFIGFRVKKSKHI